ELPVHLGRDLSVRLVNQIVRSPGRRCDGGRRKQRSPIFERSIPVSFLKHPSVRLADPLRRNPRPSRLNLGPKSLLPDHAVTVGVILCRDVETVVGRRLARLVLGSILRRASLAIVKAVGLTFAPESRHPIPSLVVSLPVAVDPESARWCDSPRPGDP